VHCERCGTELIWRLSERVMGSQRRGPDPMECKPGGLYHPDTHADYLDYCDGVASASYGQPMTPPVGR
jgi:hypothetical protein